MAVKITPEEFSMLIRRLSTQWRVWRLLPSFAAGVLLIRITLFISTSGDGMTGLAGEIPHVTQYGYFTDNRDALLF